jgi:hypothetical protein
MVAGWEKQTPPPPTSHKPANKQCTCVVRQASRWVGGWVVVVVVVVAAVGGWGWGGALHVRRSCVSSKLSPRYIGHVSLKYSRVHRQLASCHVPCLFSLFITSCLCCRCVRLTAPLCQSRWCCAPVDTQSLMTACRSVIVVCALVCSCMCGTRASQK